ncbi:hypothetical protein SBOR_2347 [Sclerotinia borealis F-4128]|uniref:Uncharacterized protein n=1 Tax=Sclerotinia borealis (strain F-4128) TaxID=1432307 RepID=W9CMM5_SCLBF|nr:hypothetical protein SBOR_2347 [Sclerotinia borealis F-4128]
MAFFLHNPHLRNLYQDIQPPLNNLNPFYSSLSDAELTTLKESHIDIELEADIRKWAQRRANIFWDKIITDNSAKNQNQITRVTEAANREYERRREIWILMRIPLEYLERVLDWPYCFDDAGADAEDLCKIITLYDGDIEFDNDDDIGPDDLFTSPREKSRYEAIHCEMKRLYEHRREGKPYTSASLSSPPPPPPPPVQDRKSPKEMV